MGKELIAVAISSLGGCSCCKDHKSYESIKVPVVLGNQYKQNCLNTAVAGALHQTYIEPILIIFSFI